MEKVKRKGIWYSLNNEDQKARKKETFLKYSKNISNLLC